MWRWVRQQLVGTSVLAPPARPLGPGWRGRAGAPGLGRSGGGAGPGPGPGPERANPAPPRARLASPPGSPGLVREAAAAPSSSPVLGGRDPERDPEQTGRGHGKCTEAGVSCVWPSGPVGGGTRLCPSRFAVSASPGGVGYPEEGPALVRPPLPPPARKECSPKPGRGTEDSPTPRCVSQEVRVGVMLLP